MRPFGRDVVVVEAAMVIRPVTDARALLGSQDAAFFAATPCMPRTLALNTEPYGSVYDDPT